MIIDNIKNANLYSNLHEGLKKGLLLIQETDFTKLEPGKYEIDENLFYTVSDYETAHQSEKRWEAHIKFMDIQYVVSGYEGFGLGKTGNMEKDGEYIAEKDLQFLKGEGFFAKVEAGDFCVLFPDDAHKPAVIADKPVNVRKVLVKIRI